MSAVWMRAQEFGQPLTLIVTGTSKSGSRRSSSSIRAIARPLVSTIASLQNSIPVQAIMCRRNTLGLTCRPAPSSSAASACARSLGTSRITIFCSAVVRTRPLPYLSASAAMACSVLPSSRPTLGANPTYDNPSRCRCTPTWSRVPFPGGTRAGPLGQRDPRLSLLNPLREPPDPPVRDQELHPRAVPKPPVAVVAEQRCHRRPHLGHLARLDERPEPLGDHRVGRKP